MRRREFLSSALTAAAAALLARRASGDVPPSLLSHLERPQDLGTPTGAFTELLTPVEQFFVRSHFGPPALDPHRRLIVDGLVGKRLDLSRESLARFAEVRAVSVLQCAGNGRAFQRPRVPGVQWAHGAMGQAEWTGVRLADLLAHAGVRDGATHVWLGGGDLPPRPTVPRFLRGIPLARALDPSTLVAWKMNGVPLSLAHGAPLRLVVPGWAGDHWVKWLSWLHVAASEAPGFYMEKAYRVPLAPLEPMPPGAAHSAATRPLAVLPVKSVIGRPSDGSSTRVGPQEVVGVAFSGGAAIARVDVSTDGGARWQAAALEGEPGVGRWQVFRHRFIATSAGRIEARARATDTAGQTQPFEAVWNPGGYLWNAIDRVSWQVIA